LDDWPWGSQQQWLLHNQSLSPGTPLPSAAFCSLPGSRGLMFIQSTISSIRFYSFVVYKNLQFLPTLSYMKVNHQCIFHAEKCTWKKPFTETQTSPRRWWTQCHLWHPQVITIYCWDAKKTMPKW
jgi:hypothetical protein